MIWHIWINFAWLILIGAWMIWNKTPTYVRYRWCFWTPEKWGFQHSGFCSIFAKQFAPLKLFWLRTCWRYCKTLKIHQNVKKRNEQKTRLDTYRYFSSVFGYLPINPSLNDLLLDTYLKVYVQNKGILLLYSFSVFEKKIIFMRIFVWMHYLLSKIMIFFFISFLRDLMRARAQRQNKSL